jgi:Na+-driven multidrug efflux pump
MGVKGAALATVIARVVEMILLITLSYRMRYIIAGPIRDYLAQNMAFIARFLRIVFPVMVNEMVWSIGVALQNVILARASTDAIAAFNIVNTVGQLTWVFFIGLGNGAAVLIGKKIGEGNSAGAKDYARRILIFGPIAACFAAIVLIPVGFALPYVFNVGPHVLHTALIMLVMLSVSYPFKAIGMCTVIGICRAGGDTIFCAFFDVAAMYLVALPAAFIALTVFGSGAPVLYLCLLAEEPIKSALGVWRFRSGKWLHDVTAGV